MNTVEKLIDRLDELQDEAMAREEAETGPSDEPTAQSMYFRGKDVGLAEAKEVIRARSDEIKE